jgi:hypothetical protein
MPNVKYLSSGADFTTIGDYNGSDITVPVCAENVQDACREIRRAYLADDVYVREIQARAFGPKAILLTVEFDDDYEALTLLVFEPSLEDGQTSMDLLAAETAERQARAAQLQALQAIGGLAALEQTLEQAREAIDDASGVVDAGEGESRAYEGALARVTEMLAALRAACAKSV